MPEPAGIRGETLAKKIEETIDREESIFHKKKSIITKFIEIAKSEGLVNTLPQNPRWCQELVRLIKLEKRIFHKDYKLEREQIRKSEKVKKEIEKAIQEDDRLKLGIEQAIAHAPPDKKEQLTNALAQLQKGEEIDRKALAEEAVLLRHEKECESDLILLRRNLTMQKERAESLERNASGTQFNKTAAHEDIRALEDLLMKQISILEKLKHHEDIAAKIAMTEEQLRRLEERLSPAIKRVRRKNTITIAAIVVIAIVVMLLFSSCAVFRGGGERADSVIEKKLNQYEAISALGDTTDKETQLEILNRMGQNKFESIFASRAAELAVHPDVLLDIIRRTEERYGTHTLLRLEFADILGLTQEQVLGEMDEDMFFDGHGAIDGLRVTKDESIQLKILDKMGENKLTPSNAEFTLGYAVNDNVRFEILNRMNDEEFTLSSAKRALNDITNQNLIQEIVERSEIQDGAQAALKLKYAGELGISQEQVLTEMEEDEFFNSESAVIAFESTKDSNDEVLQMRILDKTKLGRFEDLFVRDSIGYSVNKNVQLELLDRMGENKFFMGSAKSSLERAIDPDVERGIIDRTDKDGGQQALLKLEYSDTLGFNQYRVLDEMGEGEYFEDYNAFSALKATKKMNDETLQMKVLEKMGENKFKDYTIDDALESAVNEDVQMEVLENIEENKLESFTAVNALIITRDNVAVQTKVLEKMGENRFDQEGAINVLGTDMSKNVKIEVLNKMGGNRFSFEEADSTIKYSEDPDIIKEIIEKTNNTDNMRRVLRLKYADALNTNPEQVLDEMSEEEHFNYKSAAKAFEAVKERNDRNLQLKILEKMGRNKFDAIKGHNALKLSQDPFIMQEIMKRMDKEGGLQAASKLMFAEKLGISQEQVLNEMGDGETFSANNAAVAMNHTQDKNLQLRVLNKVGDDKFNLKLAILAMKRSADAEVMQEILKRTEKIDGTIEVLKLEYAEAMGISQEEVLNEMEDDELFDSYTATLALGATSNNNLQEMILRKMGNNQFETWHMGSALENAAGKETQIKILQKMKNEKIQPYQIPFYGRTISEKPFYTRQLLAHAKDREITKLILSKDREEYQKTVPIYDNELFISKVTEKNLDNPNAFSLALAIKRKLERENKELTQRNIEDAADVIIRQREQFENTAIIDSNTRLISYTHEEEMFDGSDILKLVEGTDVGDIPSTDLRGPRKKERIRSLIKQSEGKTTLWFSGHGGSKHQWLRSGRPNSRYDFSLHTPNAISYVELGDDLIESNNGGNVTLMIDACYSYDFAENLIGYLKSKGVRKMPTIITATNKDSVGFGNVFYKSLSKAYRKGEPLTGSDILNSQKHSFDLQDMGVFVPYDEEPQSEEQRRMDVRTIPGSLEISRSGDGTCPCEGESCPT